MKALVLLLLGALAAEAQTTNTWLKWTHSTSPNVVAYKVWYGDAPHSYFTNFATKYTNTIQVAGLKTGTRYYFTCVAINDVGKPSDNSNEVSWMAALPPTPTNPPPVVPVEVTLDTMDAGYIGTWNVSTKYGGYWGDGYVTDENSGKGTKKAYFRPTLIKGRYEVRIWYPAQKGNTSVCTTVPVTVAAATTTNTFTVNQTQNTSLWYRLGFFNFAGGPNEYVLFDNKNPGQVQVDAVRFTPSP